MPYFCEKIRGVFDFNYNKKGSLYLVDKKYFFKKKSLWKEEFISDNNVPILKEIKINNIKNYLLNLEKEGKFKFIPYEERLNYFPEIDKNIFKVILKLSQKYGKEKVLFFVRKYRSDILDKLD